MGGGSLIPSKGDAEEPKSPSRGRDPNTPRPRRSSEIEGELLWLKERLSKAADGSQQKCRGLLEVTVVSARHLPKRGKIFTKLSLCDPYMKVAYNDIEFVSIVRKNTYSPDWGQSFAFDLEDLSAVGPLRVTVMDWNKYSQHELIGVVEIFEDQIHHILFETYADWNQQHTFPILKNGLSVLGHDGNVAQVTLTFRCTARSTKPGTNFEGSFTATADQIPDSEPIITCDIFGCQEETDVNGVCSHSHGSVRSSCAGSRHDGDGFRNPSVIDEMDVATEFADEFEAQNAEQVVVPKISQLRNGGSIADRYRMASKLVSNLGVARPQDFRLYVPYISWISILMLSRDNSNLTELCCRSIPIVESPRCLPATLHQDPEDLELGTNDRPGHSSRTARRRRPAPRVVAAAERSMPAGRDDMSESVDLESW